MLTSISPFGAAIAPAQLPHENDLGAIESIIYAGGQDLRAFNLLSTIIAREPDNFDARNLRAKTEIKLARLREALADVRYVCRHPDSSDYQESIAGNLRVIISRELGI